MNFPFSKSSGWPDNRPSHWLLTSPFPHFNSRSYFLNSPIKSEVAKFKCTSPSIPKRQNTRSKFFHSLVFTVSFSLSFYLGPHYVAPGMPCTLQVMWVIHLGIWKFPDGCCWDVSHNPKNRKGQSNHNTGSGRQRPVGADVTSTGQDK